MRVAFVVGHHKKSKGANSVFGQEWDFYNEVLEYLGDVNVFYHDENINGYTPEATNTAGTQRLQDGTKLIRTLVAKENILVGTDNELYTMKFVGAQFTFGLEPVGNN